MAGDSPSNSKNGEVVKHFKQCRFYKENYGRYMSWGMFLPMNRWHLPLYYIIIGVHLPVIFYSGYLLFEEEFGVFIEVIHFAMLIILSILGIACLDEALMKKMIWYYEEGFDVYGETIDKISAKKIKRINSKMLKRKKFHSAFMYYGLYGASSSFCLIRPVYDWLSGKYQNISYKDNVNRMLPLNLWYPLDVSSWPVYIYLLLLEYYAISQTTFLVIGSTIIYISVSEELCAQIRILKATLKNIARRAKHVGNGETTKENVKECLKRSIIHHCKIIKWFDMFQTYFSRALWLILTITTYLICLCAFITTMKSDITLTNKLTAVAFLVLEIFYLLVYCWYGEEIQAESADLHFEIYDSDWIDFQVDIKNYLLIIEQRAYYPLKMYGGLIAIDLNTFSNVCNTAYSFFNFLNASQN